MMVPWRLDTHLPRFRGASIRARLTLWNIGVLAVVLATLGTTLGYLAQTVVLASVDRELTDRALLLMEGASPRPAQAAEAPAGAEAGRAESTHTASNEPFAQNARDAAPGGVTPHAVRRPARFLLRLFDVQGRALSSGVYAIPWDPRTFQLSARGHQAYSTVHDDAETYRVYSAPVRWRSEIVGVLQIAEPLGEIEMGLQGLSHALWILAPLALLISGLGGAFLTDRGLQPVSEIAHTAEQIGAGNLSERLHLRGEDEFTQLGRTMNRMLDRLERAFRLLEASCEQQRRFTADVSHELRTPLTVIKAQTSLALARARPAEEYRQALAAADQAADQMNRTVQDLLLLARSDAGHLALYMRPTPIGNVLESAVELLADRLAAPIEIRPVDPTLCVPGDQGHLIRLVANLLENAVRHTPPDGRIRVAALGTATSVLVRVEDTGEGIAPEHLPHVMERFYRADRSRSRSEGGAGLGLAICRSIVEAHEGSISIESAPGHGTVVRIRLPRTEDAHAVRPGRDGASDRDGVPGIRATGD